MIRSWIHIGLFVFFVLPVFGQQEQLYTMFIYNKQLFNPAYAGSEDIASLNLLYRDQWNGFEGAPKTQLLSFSAPINASKIGLGFNLVNHSIGIENKLSLEAVYAYRIKSRFGNLGLGLQTSVRRYGIDFSDDRIIATQSVDLDPSILGQSFSKSIYNFGVGVYFNTKVYYLGVALPKLARNNLDFDTNNNFSNEQRHLNLMGGAAFAINKKITLRPQGLYKWVPNAPYDLDLNLGLSYMEKFTVALNYRHGGIGDRIGESLDVIFALQRSKNLMIACAYDLGLSEVRSYHNGSFELMAKYIFAKKPVQEEIINPRYF